MEAPNKTAKTNKKKKSDDDDDDHDDAADKINWTENRKHDLAKLVKKHVGHYKTSSLGYKQKYALVLSELLARESFKGDPHLYKTKPMSLKKSFDRFLTKIRKQFGVSDSSCNTSGLPEKPSDYESLMLQLSNEKFERDVECKSESKADKLKTQVMDSINGQMLKNQGSFKNSTSSFSSNDEVTIASPENTSITNSSVSSNDQTENQKKRPKLTYDAKSLISETAKELKEAIESIQNSGEEDPEMKQLQKELLKNQIEAAKKQAVFYDLQIQNHRTNI